MNCFMPAGDGYLIDQSIIQRSGSSDASIFFNRLVKKPYVNQFMGAPHVYCGEVTGQTTGTSGQALYTRMSRTFGWMTNQGKHPG